MRRKKYSAEETFDFIEICEKFEIELDEKVNWLSVILLVEKDAHGISQRVQICEVDLEKWENAKPKPKTVYLI